MRFRLIILPGDGINAPCCIYCTPGSLRVIGDLNVNPDLAFLWGAHIAGHWLFDVNPDLALLLGAYYWRGRPCLPIGHVRVAFVNGARQVAKSESVFGRRK